MAAKRHEKSQKEISMQNLMSTRHRRIQFTPIYPNRPLRLFVHFLDHPSQNSRTSQAFAHVSDTFYNSPDGTNLFRGTCAGGNSSGPTSYVANGPIREDHFTPIHCARAVLEHGRSLPGKLA